MDNGIVGHWFLDPKETRGKAREWAAALSLVPDGELFQDLHASLPSWVKGQASSGLKSSGSSSSKGKTA